MYIYRIIPTLLFNSALSFVALNDAWKTGYFQICVCVVDFVYTVNDSQNNFAIKTGFGSE